MKTEDALKLAQELVTGPRAKDHLHIIRPKDIYKGYKI